MKVIILDNGETEIYLHVNKITRTYAHKYAHYTKTTVHMKNYQIFISDIQHGNFNTLLHEFIQSNEKLQILKVKDVVIHEIGEVYVTLADWVSQAMNRDEL